MNKILMVVFVLALMAPRFKEIYDEMEQDKASNEDLNKAANCKLKALGPPAYDMPINEYGEWVIRYEQTNI